MLTGKIEGRNRVRFGKEGGVGKEVYPESVSFGFCVSFLKNAQLNLCIFTPIIVLKSQGN